MLFIDYDEWMRLTYTRMSRRSAALQRLDLAIQRSNASSASDETVQSWYMWDGTMTEAGKLALKVDEAVRRESIRDVTAAFNNWVGGRLDDWRSSGRDSNGAVTRLYGQLNYYATRVPLPASEADAVAAIREARDKSIPALFAGCTVETKSSTLDKAKQKKQQVTIVKDVRKVGQAIPLNVKKLVEDAVHDAFGISFEHAQGASHHGGVAQALLTEVVGKLKHLLADIAPGVGLATSIGKVIKDVVKLYNSATAMDELTDLNARLPGSDPKSALDAVHVWQVQDIAKTSSGLARHSANAGGQLAGILTAGAATPAQMAIGIANAILELTEIIADLGLQYRSKTRLTKYLNESEVLGRDIFAQSPLVGAYFLMNTPVSHIALCFVNIGGPAWREEIEVLKKHGALKTVITESARVISASRYEICRPDGQKFRTVHGKKKAVKPKALAGKEGILVAPPPGEAGPAQLRRIEGIGSNSQSA